jgi:hypothetical protein
MANGSKKSLKGGPAKKSGPVLREERYMQIFDAHNSLDLGLEIMRLIQSGFDTDGKPHFTARVVDMHGDVGTAIGHIKKAASLLFEYHSEDKDARKSQAFLQVIWDSADIVICVKATLQHKKLPHGHGMTCCPVRGALMVAIGMLEGIASDISAFLATAGIAANPIGPVASNAGVPGINRGRAGKPGETCHA